MTFFFFFLFLHWSATWKGITLIEEVSIGGQRANHGINIDFIDNPSFVYMLLSTVSLETGQIPF